MRQNSGRVSAGQRALRWSAYLAGVVLATSAVIYGLAIIALSDLEKPSNDTFAGNAAGALAASAGADGTAKLWRQGEQIAVVRGHAAPLGLAELAGPNGPLLTASLDGSLRITDVKAIEQVHRFGVPWLSDAFLDALWQPFGLEAARWCLSLVAQVLPIDIPPSLAGRRGRIFKDCPDCPEMIEIGSGAAFIGSPLVDIGRHGNEGPRRLVMVDRGMAVSRFEVTVRQWAACVADNGCGGYLPARRRGAVFGYLARADEAGNLETQSPTRGAGGGVRLAAEPELGGLRDTPGLRRGLPSVTSPSLTPPPAPVSPEVSPAPAPLADRQPPRKAVELGPDADLAVANISWEDAKGYLDWLSKRTGKLYRLLSRVEWEYVARAGTATPYPWGTADEVPHVSDIGGGLAVPPGNYPPNGFGLFDMHQSLAEWTEDCYRDVYGEDLTSAPFVQRGTCLRVVRGGGSFKRSAARDGAAQNKRDPAVGLRVARALQP